MTHMVTSILRFARGEEPMLLSRIDMDQLLQEIVLDLQALVVTTSTGTVLPCDPIPGFLLDMVAAGGLLNQLRQRLGRSA